MPAPTGTVQRSPEQEVDLSFLIHTQTAPTGRSANSLAWAGLANTYFWIDRRG
jgi:methyl acetate hydrolase